VNSAGLPSFPDGYKKKDYALQVVSCQSTATGVGNGRDGFPNALRKCVERKIKKTDNRGVRETLEIVTRPKKDSLRHVLTNGGRRKQLNFHRRPEWRVASTRVKQVVIRITYVDRKPFSALRGYRLRRKPDQLAVIDV